VIRYLILFPTRIIVTIISVSWLIICTAAIGCLPDGAFKRTIYWHSSLVCFRIMARAFSGIVTFHDRHNMAKPGGITVANHTSPIVSFIYLYLFLVLYYLHATSLSFWCVVHCRMCPF